MSKRLVIASMLAAVFVGVAAESRAADIKSLLVYVGTYSGQKSKGIYVYRLDPASGELKELGVAAESNNPSFLAIAPNHRFLFAANELWNNRAGQVSSFSIDPATGKLTAINSQPSGGKSPCFVAVDPTNKNLLAANYSSGTLSVFPIGADGKLGEATSTIQHQGKGPNPKRQEGPHAHSINLDPAGKFAFACDLGLDKVFIYRLDPEKGTITLHGQATVAPGSGPRHFAWHPNGKFAYVINEMGCTITAFAYDASAGSLTQIETLPTLPADFKGENTCAEVAVHPSGKFVYGSNRGHNSIAIFSVDQTTGKLTAVGHESSQGKTPRNFGIDPSGRYLIAANQDSDNIVMFRIDIDTGKLTPTGTNFKVGSPVCVKYLIGD